MQVQSSGNGTSVVVILPTDGKKMAPDEWKFSTASPSQRA